MNCSDWRQRIVLRVDGSLPANESATLDEHLKSCASCSRWLEDARRLRAAITGMKHAEPPAELWNRIEGATKSIRPSAHRPMAFRRAVWVAAAAALVLIAVCVGLLAGRERPPLEATPPPPRNLDIQVAEKKGEPGLDVALLAEHASSAEVQGLASAFGTSSRNDK
jgi:anti-sigma factor RsiW